MPLRMRAYLTIASVGSELGCLQSRTHKRPLDNNFIILRLHTCDMQKCTSGAGQVEMPPPPLLDPS
ncbi:hypothetical protein BCV70DRAFT_201692 [Testicularia cyperi]|uniref:Uncharacterized protein n=1 Tax=Testicularia cyperi TaxID=1882483 RepID=A0A317XNP9_9BASI|nr:hypothetical protein BCV70DRAFT_201692 [Testicularia cyperi]